MANNRMFLVHRPSGLTVCLGKRMGSGWYKPPTEEKMQAFYDAAEQHWVDTPGTGSSLDDFMLVLEDSTDAPMCGTFDRYGEAGPEEFREPKRT